MQHKGSRRRHIKSSLLLIILAGLVLLTACGEDPGPVQAREAPNGDPERGQEILREYSCGACHVIPGIVNAESTVGPPLTEWADRQYIAGKLPNTPANLIRWIQYPQAVEPGTAMPNLDVTERDARDMAAYLYTLGGASGPFSRLKLFDVE